MLFKSAEFLLFFLPIVVALVAVLRRVAAAPALVVLLLVAGRIATAGPTQRRRWLIAGIVLNLTVLGWFKYALFIAGVLRDLRPFDPQLGTIVLPIGFSFYTFQQIAYLVDVGRDPAVDRDPLRYALFVSFFPRRIAGPIVHHRELMPQLARLGQGPLLPDLAVGLADLLSRARQEALARRQRRADRHAAVHRRRGWRAARPRCRVGRRDRLRAADLLRLLGLLGHGDRPCPDFRHRAADQRRLALPGDLDRRFLAPLAHHPVPLPA